MVFLASEGMPGPPLMSAGSEQKRHSGRRMPKNTDKNVGGRGARGGRILSHARSKGAKFTAQVLGFLAEEYRPLTAQEINMYEDARAAASIFVFIDEILQSLRLNRLSLCFSWLNHHLSCLVPISC